jgi:hypothetical protein
MLIPKQIQCSILAALLGGRLPEGFSLAQVDGMFYGFEARWRRALERLLFAMENEAEGVQRTSFIASMVFEELTANDRREIEETAEENGRLEALNALDLPAIEWVWERWIPRGMLTVMGAMPSAGKSYVMLDLAARVIAGTTWPDGSAVGRSGPVIYVDAENVPQIQAQRARAWGMDQSRLFLMRPEDTRLMVDFGDDYDRDRLLQGLWQLRPEMVVVDSLSTISTKGENNVEEVRSIFSFLSRAALDYGCGMVIIHHLRKPGAQQLPLPKFLSFNDLRGSSHITAMSRSIIGLHWVQTGQTMDLNSPRRMEVLKTNLCRYPKALGVEFRSMETDEEVAELVYGEAPSEWEEPTKKKDCADWLIELLGDVGELAPKEIMEAAEEAGYNERMVYRARKDLGDLVVDTQKRRHPGNKWRLAGDEEEEEPEESNSDTLTL